MATPAPGSGDQTREKTAAAATTPATTTTLTDGQSGPDNAAPVSADSIQTPQVAASQAGHRDDEDSDFDELDGKHYLSTPPSHTIPYHTTPQHPAFSLSRSSTLKFQKLQTS